MGSTNRLGRPHTTNLSRPEAKFPSQMSPRCGAPSMAGITLTMEPSPYLGDRFLRDSPELERLVRKVHARDVRACPALSGRQGETCPLWPGLSCPRRPSHGERGIRTLERGRGWRREAAPEGGARRRWGLWCSLRHRGRRAFATASTPVGPVAPLATLVKALDIKTMPTKAPARTALQPSESRALSSSTARSGDSPPRPRRHGRALLNRGPMRSRRHRPPGA
jgi:hypothetical protein